MKGLSKHVRNEYIIGAKERLEARLFKEAEEKTLKETEEKARLEAEEQARKEAEEKASVEAAAAEAKAKAKADAKKEKHIVAEGVAKSTEVALTRGESSTSGIAPLMLQKLEELQKEQQLVRDRLDKQDSVNSSIQNLLTQLLQRMPPPPNP